MRTELHLHEQLLLLVLRDRKGTLDYRATHYNLAMAGAILAELALSDRIRIGRDRKALVEPVRTARRTGNDILDEAFAKVRDARRPRRAAAWVTTFGSLKRLWHRTALGLCRRGILRAGESEILLVFRRKVYPTLDPGPERDLVARLRQAITGDSEVEPELGVVLALLHVAGAIGIHFDRKQLRPHRKRLKEIGAGHHIGPSAHPAVAAHRAVQGAVAAAQAAAVGAVGVLATLAVLACGGGGGDGRPDAAEGPRTVFRDSAGIRIVENTNPPEGSRLDWRIGPEPLVSIGQREGDAPYLLDRVFGAAMLSDGRIVVGDDGWKELRVFDREGTYLETWGGRGEGPGEFGGGQLWGMAKLQGDSIFVWEYFVPRFTMFGPEGFVRGFMLQESGFGMDRWRRSHFWGLDVSRDGWILGGQDVVRNDPAEFALWDSEGSFRRSLGTHPGREAIREEGPEPREMEPVTFFRSTLLRFWGGQILISNNRRHEHRAYALDGSLARIVRLDRAPRAPTGDHIEAMIEREVSGIPADETQSRAERRRELLGRTVAEHLPAFYYYGRVDALDHLWVFEYEAPGEETPGRLAAIFDPDGRVLGYFEVPEALSILEIGADYVLGLVRDEFGVPTVQLLPFER